MSPLHAADKEPAKTIAVQAGKLKLILRARRFTFPSPSDAEFAEWARFREAELVESRVLRAV
jgi:hypothetical protein